MAHNILWVSIHSFSDMLDGNLHLLIRDVCIHLCCRSIYASGSPAQSQRYIIETSTHVFPQKYNLEKDFGNNFLEISRARALLASSAGRHNTIKRIRRHLSRYNLVAASRYAAAYNSALYSDTARRRFEKSCIFHRVNETTKKNKKTEKKIVNTEQKTRKVCKI
jgi:hypothetical protein